MSYFTTRKQRKEEEYLYSAVTEEIERNEIFKPLWMKALADSNFDKQRTQALYIKYRVQKIKDDISNDQDVQKEEDIRKEQTTQKQKEFDEKNNPNRIPSELKIFIIIGWIVFAISLLMYLQFNP